MPDAEPRPRRSNRRRDDDNRPTADKGARSSVPSVTEVAIYTLLAAAIASGVFVVGGRPYSHVAMVVAAALVIIALSALVSRRAGNAGDSPDVRDQPDAGEPPAAPPTDIRRGRRRRR